MHTDPTLPTLEASAYFDATAADYDDVFSDDSVWSIAHEIGLELLLRHLEGRQALTIADIGCGTGKWSALLAPHAREILLSDVSGSMLEVASAKPLGVPTRSILASVDRLEGIDSAAFDLVLCMGDPLSYVGDYRAGIAEVARIAKPGALIFVSVDSRYGYLRILKEKHGSDVAAIAEFMRTGDIVGWEGLPLHAYTEDELRGLFGARDCEAVGVWQLPSVSSYFLFEKAFRDQLAQPALRKAVIAMERAESGRGAAGPHHLYGLFRKTK